MGSPLEILALSGLKIMPATLKKLGGIQTVAPHLWTEEHIANKLTVMKVK